MQGRDEGRKVRAGFVTGRGLLALRYELPGVKVSAYVSK